VRRYIALAVLFCALMCSPVHAWYGQRWQVVQTPRGTYFRYEMQTPYGYYWVVRFFPNYNYRR